MTMIESEKVGMNFAMTKKELDNLLSFLEQDKFDKEESLTSINCATSLLNRLLVAIIKAD